jgi:hypothetical protein
MPGIGVGRTRSSSDIAAVSITRACSSLSDCGHAIVAGLMATNLRGFAGGERSAGLERRWRGRSDRHQAHNTLGSLGRIGDGTSCVSPGYP